MADQHILPLLKKRVRTWNQWQRRHANIRPDLRNAELSGAQLSFAQLPRADLHRANLAHTLFCSANLRYADLSNADLSYANLGHADLSHANLTNANLSHARLNHTNLHETIFRETTLSNTNLTFALLHNTILANIDLSTVVGLDSIFHLSPSTIDLKTISRLQHTIIKDFLRREGVHENLITSIGERGEAPFDYATCFISYASEDQIFVQRLQERLQQEGVWCWFAPHSLKGGDFFKARIENAISQCDKLLVVFSKHALASDWVKYEVELARQKERKKNAPILLPLRLDTAILEEPGWAAFLQNKRHIRNFEHHEQSRSYQEEMKHLLRDLRL